MLLILIILALLIVRRRRQKKEPANNNEIPLETKSEEGGSQYNSIHLENSSISLETTYTTYYIICRIKSFIFSIEFHNKKD